jgi:hypothetical protein
MEISQLGRSLLEYLYHPKKSPYRKIFSLMENYFLQWKNIFYYRKYSSVMENSATIFYYGKYICQSGKYCSMRENIFPRGKNVLDLGDIEKIMTRFQPQIFIRILGWVDRTFSSNRWV